jgi:hypothetical protein
MESWSTCLSTLPFAADLSQRCGADPPKSCLSDMAFRTSELAQRFPVKDWPILVDPGSDANAETGSWAAAGVAGLDGLPSAVSGCAMTNGCGFSWILGAGRSGSHNATRDHDIRCQHNLMQGRLEVRRPAERGGACDSVRGVVPPPCVPTEEHGRANGVGDEFDGNKRHQLESNVHRPVACAVHYPCDAKEPNVPHH